jgi:hypothetical protein
MGFTGRIQPVNERSSLDGYPEGAATVEVVAPNGDHVQADGTATEQRPAGPLGGGAVLGTVVGTPPEPARARVSVRRSRQCLLPGADAVWRPFAGICWAVACGR